MNPMTAPGIAGYELLACLGGGTMSSVYSARALGNERPCAVKVLRPEWAGDATAIKLLQREARAGLAVRHPHLVRLHDVHVTRPPYYLVMELLAGESLRRRLRRDYRVDVPTAVWIARQTADALSTLHRAGFIHGDVKPDNLRLVGDGKVVLLDLGFAHHPEENTPLLREGYLLGTPDYLAPELCGSEPRDDFSSDLFSLGVMLFEMLSGQLPYPPGSLAKTLLRHEADPPRDIRDVAPELPEPLARLVHRLLNRRPNNRPRAHQVVQQLIPLEISALGRRRAA